MPRLDAVILTLVVLALGAVTLWVLWSVVLVVVQAATAGLAVAGG